MARASGSDRDSFTDWVLSGQDRWLRVAYLLTGDRHRAEDLLQDALIAVARRWETLHSGSPEAYLRRCLYHSQVSWWRRRREYAVAEVNDVGVDPIGGLEQRVVVMDALARLTTKQRTVVILRYYEDLTEAAVADLLGIHVGTVKSQTAAAMRRLRDQSPELGELLGRGGTR